MIIIMTSKKASLRKKKIEIKKQVESCKKKRKIKKIE